ncbi:TOR3A protein, partial [Nothocercus julius]|nr:TOR3A protein [Nothocercus julius]
GWSLALARRDYLEILRAWYCSFGRYCESGDCRVVNNITGLELDLTGQLHGQHLASEVVIRAVRGFVQSPRPDKALVLSFHGWSGTGKNFVARMVASHLYRDGLRSECVRTFVSLFHFPHRKFVDSYKVSGAAGGMVWARHLGRLTLLPAALQVQLAKQLSETTQLCRQSLFIFDEAEKLHSGLLDAIKPFMARYDNEGQAGNWRSIFLFLSSIGGNSINEAALDFWRAGRPREEIPLELLEQQLRQELLQPADSGYARSHFLEENLVDFFVPFLPLERRHVRLCARDAFLARGLPYTEAALDEVAEMMVFVPEEEKLFSAQGCKAVSQRISYFLP